MQYSQMLLSDPDIHARCLAALEDERQLDAALEMIYSNAFKDTPQRQDASALFIQRLKDVRAEYTAQLSLCLTAPEQWKDRQLHLTRDPDALVCCLAILASLVHAQSWEQSECLHLLELRMKNAPASHGRNLQLLQLFMQTPMDFIFAAGEYPRLPASAAARFASLLAMLSYACAKGSNEANILPDVSFDAICIWSNAMTDALCIRNGASTGAAATVGCVMACQYMHIPEWDVLKKSMPSLKALSHHVMSSIIDQLRTSLLPCVKVLQPFLTEWVWPEAAAFRFTSWLHLLQAQLEAAPEDPDTRLEDEPEFLQDSSTEITSE